MGEISYLNVLSDRAYPVLTLCKPDRTVIRYLEDIYGLSLVIRLGAINELSFTIPTMVTRNHKLEVNPLIDLIKDRFYAKMEFEGQTEYFLFLDKNKQLASDGTSVSYTAYGAAIELSDKDVRSYLEETKNLSYHANEILLESIWELGFVDASFDIKYRTLDIPSATALQSILDLAEKYNALLTFDTVNRKINFYEPNSVGINRGLQLREGHLLDSLTVQSNSEEIVTRLRVYGQDGLEFRSLSPTGSNYIEDYSYFMYPFEIDANDNIIKHSDYMSDSLCLAITRYKRLLLNNQGLFNSLVTQRTDKRDQIQQENQALSVLKTRLVVLEDELWVINRTYQDQAPMREDWIAASQAVDAQKLLITNKESEIELLNNQYTEILNQITQLGNTLKVENNFTSDQIKEWNKFIIVKDYTNDSIIEEEDLLSEAEEIFNTLKQPSLNVSVSMEGYVESVRDKLPLQRISIGDIISTQSEELNVDIKLRTTEINIDFENKTIKLNIANGLDVIDENARFTKFIADASSTSTTVNIDKGKWNKGGEAYDSVTQLLNSEFDTAKNTVIGGYENTTTINHRGLFSQDYEDENTYLVINNAIMAITADNGNSIEVAISKNGVHAERLIGRMILSNKLEVADEDNVITIQNGKMTVYDNNNVARVELGRYVDPLNVNNNKYGLLINNGAIDIRTGSTNSEGVVITSTGISGYNSSGIKTFELNSETGKSSINDNFSIETDKDVLKGVKFDDNGIRGYNVNTGELTFNIDTATGSPYFKGDLEASTINGGVINGTSITSANIDIAESIKVGNSINLGDLLSSDLKVIRFNGVANIYSQNDAIGISGESINILDNTYIGSNNTFTRFRGSVEFGDAIVSGLPTPDLSGYAYGHTSGIGIAWSASANRLYVRINGGNVGYINLEGP